MKKLIRLSVLFLLSFSFACKDDCSNTAIPACKETVPTGELCQAAFNRWFYSSDTQTCEEKFYSGCSQKGFATKVECEECKCK